MLVDYFLCLIGMDLEIGYVVVDSFFVVGNMEEIVEGLVVVGLKLFVC